MFLPPFIRRWFYPILRRTIKQQIFSAPDNFKSNMDIFQIKLADIHHRETTLEDYRGKKILIVNIASECGYTPQLTSMEKLHEQMSDRVVVLGFPCNDFGAQEPGSEEVIENFCSKNYGVTFTLFSKINILGDEIHPLYKWLSDPTQNGWNSKLPNWNFCKYLIDENGKLLKYFSFSVDPMDEKVLECFGR